LTYNHSKTFNYSAYFYGRKKSDHPKKDGHFKFLRDGAYGKGKKMPRIVRRGGLNVFTTE